MSGIQITGPSWTYKFGSHLHTVMRLDEITMQRNVDREERRVMS